MYLSIPETDASNYLTYSTRFGELAFCVYNLCLPFFTVTVLSYHRALSWTCIPEYKLVFKKKKKKKPIFPEGLYPHTVGPIVNKASEVVTGKSDNLLARFDF
jgi:hypothetical protein